MSENYRKAEKDYIKGLKYKEIAEKYNVSLNTVKSWKQRYGWTREKGAPSKKSVHTKKKGAPKGSKNALGNRGGSAPKGNNNAVTHGFFSKFLPPETLEIMEGMEERTVADLIYDQIRIQYAAIIRAQNIMLVQDRDDITKVLKKERPGKFGDELEYEFQFSWDKHATFMNAQSRAMSELRGLIKQFDELAHVGDERRLRLEKMRHDMKMKQQEVDIKQKEIEKKNTPPEKPDISEYINAMSGQVKEVFDDE